MLNLVDKIYTYRFMHPLSCVINDTENYFLEANKFMTTYSVFKNVDYNEDHYYIETCCNQCYLCNKNICLLKNKKKLNFLKKNQTILNDSVINKIDSLIIDKNNIFKYTKTEDIGVYYHYYYHICSECLLYGLYYWSLYYDTPRPKTALDGYKFIKEYNIFVPIHKNVAILKSIENNLFSCDVYNVN